MTQRLIAAATLVLAGAAAAIGWFVFNDPTTDQREWVRAQLMTAESSADNTRDGGSAVDFVSMEQTIANRNHLWTPVIPQPRQAPPAPDMEGPLRDVEITRESMGFGDDLRVRIRTGSNRRGRWMGVGDVLNGLTIKEITDTEVVFSKESHGREYTTQLRRGRR